MIAILNKLMYFLLVFFRSFTAAGEAEEKSFRPLPSPYPSEWNFGFPDLHHPGPEDQDDDTEDETLTLEHILPEDQYFYREEKQSPTLPRATREKLNVLSCLNN